MTDLPVVRQRPAADLEVLPTNAGPDRRCDHAS